MPKQTIVSHPNWFKLITAKHIKMTAPKFEFGIEFDKEVKAELEKNPVLQAKLWEPAQALFKKMIDELDSAVYVCERGLKDKLKRLQTCAEIKALTDGVKVEILKEAEKIVKDYSEQMKKATLAKWEELKKKNKLSTKYKIKNFVVGVQKAGSITLSVGSLVASGGTNVLAWITLTRAVVSSVDEARKTCSSMKSCGERLSKSVKNLQDTFYGDLRLDAAKQALDAVYFATIGAHAKTTYASCQKELKNFRARIAVLETNHTKMGKSVSALMAQIKKDESKLPDFLKPKKEKLEKKLDKLLIAVAALGAELDVHKKTLADAERTLDSLLKAKVRNILGIAETLVTLAVSAGKIATSAALLDAGGAIDGLEQIGEEIAKAVEKNSAEIAKIAA